MESFDIIIIGAGAAGLNAAFSAVENGKKTVLIDKYRPGGECTWSGCIPSKAFLQIAKEYQQVKKHTPAVEINTALIMDTVRERVQVAHVNESVEKIQENGIYYICGHAEIQTNNSVKVNDEIVYGDSIIIATGSHARIPTLSGLQDIEYLTNENFFQQKELPTSLLVIGGGPIGIELAQASSRLGVEVIVVERNPRILMQEEEVTSELIQHTVEYEGVEVHTSARVETIETQSSGIVCTIINSSGDKIIRQVDKVLLATGREPNSFNIGLKNVGIEKVDEYIKVDECFQTSIPNIYAVGDVIGTYLFSHAAGYQARELIKYICSAGNHKIKHLDHTNITWSTFTEPEVARLGLTEVKASEIYSNIQVLYLSYKELDRAIVDDKTTGFAKVICDSKGYIVGATIVGERASELLSELQLARMEGIPIQNIKNTIHSYPSYSELIYLLSTNYSLV